MFALLSGCAGKDMKLANRGSAALVMNDYQNAEKYLGESLALNPNNPYALFNMGVVYEKTGRQQKAISMYQKVLELNPKEKGAQSSNGSANGRSITELARRNLLNLQIKMAMTSRFTEEPVLSRLEEPDLKDFFPVLKKPEIEDPASGKADEPAVAQETRRQESTNPMKESDPTSEIEKKILEPFSPPPATTEVKKAEEATVILSPEPQKTDLPEKVYSIQVASYKNLDGAVKRTSELIESGYDAYYKKTFIKGKGTWQRIFVDKFKSKEEALDQARTMKDQKVISDYMIRIIKQ
jgi:cell division protein FtsN